ncbi:MAG: 2-phospho-L-lactate transferase [Pseudomonadota bacterium]
MSATTPLSVLALSGGVGGAKLTLGLSDVMDSERLNVLVNTADDFRHFGLQVCPDIDTVVYTLAGLSNSEQGWGLADETFHALKGLERLGGDTWFQLGDFDLATHLWRSERLAGGHDLLQVTHDLAVRLGVHSRIHPMSADPVSTLVCCEQGELPFQHYFVREQCAPSVTGFRFEGIDQARPNEQVLALLREQPLAAIIVCPSNPFVSIDPILQLPGLWTTLKESPTPVVLVCPIVAGQALKGPAAKMMTELGVPVTALGVAEYYCGRYPGLLNHFVIDTSDAKLAADIEQMGLRVTVTPTVMKTRQDKAQLASTVLAVAAEG